MPFSCRAKPYGAVMSTAPWWATGAFTLAGVLLAQFAAFALNRSRDRFEDSRRWHEDRRDIYLAVVVNAWKIQDAVYGRFELNRPLPDDLAMVFRELEVARTKVQLVGSEEVREVTERLTIEGSAAMTSANASAEGRALDACDNIRHRLYYLTDLMRSELTSNKAAVRQWHRRRRRPKRPA
jgi:hypothetical protein